MAFQFLAADTSISTSSPLSCKETGVQFEGQESCALFLKCKGSSVGRWFQGADKAGASHHRRNGEMYHATEAYRCTERMFRGSTKSVHIHGCVESGKTSVPHSKKESRVCLGFGLHQGCANASGLYGSDDHKQTISGDYEDMYRLSRFWNFSCLPQGRSSFELRNPFQRRHSNACQCFFPNFLKKGFFATEKDDRQRALLSLCAQAMVASQIGQSTLLSFLWMNWPSMVDELCGGGNGGGSKNNTSNGQSREPDNASFFQSSIWKALLLGFVCGSVIALAINSSMSAGALLDACLWLCLLCSFLYLAAFVMRILCSMVMFIAEGGITMLPNSCMQALQKWIHMSFCRGFFAGLSALLTGMLWHHSSLKPRSSTASLSVSSLWSRLSTKIKGKRVGSTQRGILDFTAF